MTAQVITLPPRKPSKAKPEITLRTFLDQCKAAGGRVFPEDDPLYAYAENVGLPEEWLKLCWKEFCHRHLDPANRGNRRQRNWRAVFRNCVRDNWYGIWYVNDEDEMRLSSKGRLLKKAHEAKA